MARARTRPAAPSPSDRAADTAVPALHPGAPHTSGARRPLSLPPRPAELRDLAVAAWAEPVTIDTYPVPAPDRNPLFLEHRVYQGSSGRVYPNAVTDHLSDVPEPRTWQALHLENEHLRVMLLPEIGGRIHVVQDRHTGYDLVYRQNVIKPALVGLLGPWISGGIELNWPQHHRPTTFMPTDWRIEALPDGGAVAWCSEHEPMQRMKGMHGAVLRPGSSVLELRVRLVNRTPLLQTFLWWANVAVRVHDGYEAYFPPDVRYVADHARRAMSTFPVARGHYYGVDYGSRSPAEADLRWYRNIPVPTSYMAMGSEQDFFGGYDHAAGEGYVHWADHAIAPGKKLWTWGDHAFGHAWDRELTDDDGPYVELMAGVFTDNQPDFSYLLPGEVRTFSQHWYPIVGTGPVQAATLEAAVSLVATDGGVRVGVAVTAERPDTLVRLTAGESQLLERRADLAPQRPLLAEVELPHGFDLPDLCLSVQHGGRELLAYRPVVVAAVEPPPPATEPPPPDAIDSLEELYLTGLHLQQYRHATRQPEAYWQEALRRDPGDSRCRTAMGEWHLRRGELAAAERHLRAALARLTRRNPNPRHGEASYLLGLVLCLRGDTDAADAAFGKASWDGGFAAAAMGARAELSALRGDFAAALAFADQALALAPRLPVALGLRAALLRRAGRREEAAAHVAAMLAADPLDARALHEQALLADADDRLPGGTQTALDLAHDEARAGLLDEALDALRRAEAVGADPGTAPLLQYTIAWLAARKGDESAAAAAGELARAATPDRCFPARLEEIVVLEWAIGRDPHDARAHAYLGHLLYDRRRYEEAIHHWRAAVRVEPSLATVHRNLGIAEFNVLRRPERARAAYRRALRVDPTDARVLYEYDQLRKRLGDAPATRLADLEAQGELALERDDLAVELVTLLDRVGRFADAVAILAERRFHPWEGGEGLVSAQWVVSHRELARLALWEGRPRAGIELLRRAMERPANLGEGKHLLLPENELQWLLGRCLAVAGDLGEARRWWQLAATPQGDPAAPPGDGPYWQALALRELGELAAAEARLAALLAAARRAGRSEVRIPYFATSLPTLLLFEDDLSLRTRQEARYLEGLALLGQGRREAAWSRFVDVLAARPEHLEAALRLAETDAA